MALLPPDEWVERWVCDQHGITREPCPCRQDYVPTYQRYWRCAHHPSALQNFFARRYACEWGCNEMKPQRDGKHPQPMSWGTKNF